MNTTVNFELAKLLKEKGFDFPRKASQNDYQGEYPTIAEVVMWLYEKHGIWISVIFKRHSENKHFAYNIREMNGIETYLWEHNTPTEAYEVAIKYTLENLI